MTSTNDGKEVKSYQTSGPKGKSHYIELYKSLEARLSEVGEASVRTQHLCEAWRQVHTLCLHSSLSTHPHLLSWLQRHTARTILQTKWQSPDRKDDRATLETAIDGFIAQCQQASSERENYPWETQLVARGEWFKKVSDRPWDHPVLSVLLNPSGTPPTDDEVLSWLVPERGVTFVMRLLTLVAEKCEDIAAALTAAVMDRVRARIVLVPDQLQTDDNKDKSALSPALSGFGEKLSSEAGFTTEVWELLTDIEFVLLYKRDRSRCIALAKQTPLKNAYQLVERLQSRLELAPREKRLWKNSKDVAVLISQVVITRCMVIPVCTGVGRNALYCCSRSLARALGPKLATAAAQLAAPAASARHLHTLATAVDAHFTQNNDQKMKPFVCELYVRAITAGMNELERLKIKTEKEAEARQMEQTLASWFVQLGAVLSSSDRIRCECTLTAFSVHPSMIMYERIKAAPTLPKSAAEIESPSKESASEFGSWASDSRSQTNFVKTSETLNMKKTQNQANVLSTALLNEGEALGLSPDLCHDIAVLLSGPRVKTLSWDMDREQLLEKCQVYMERTHGGTRALTTELKYLNLDPNEFMHLPEEDDDENDLYYGIEKGYEHLVQFQDPEDIWKDTEQTESAHSAFSGSDTDVVTSRRKKTGKKVAISSDEDADPLSIIAETQRNEKKERPHSKERSKERKKKESRDPLEINPPKERKEKLPKKEKKERKKKVKSSRESLAKLIGIKVLQQPSRPKKAANTSVTASFVTDSDYDSQGKSSFTSVNSEHTDILYDGLFSMDELKSPERDRKHSENIGLNYNEFNVSNSQVGLNYPNNQPVVDPHRKPVSYLSHSPNVVTDEVKKSLCKLIDNRRQKVMTPGNQSPIPSNIDLDNSITAFKSYKTSVSKNISPQTPQKKVQNAITRPKTPLQTCISPKAVAIPEIPKSIISKDSQRMVQIKKDVEDGLQRYQRNLNDTSIPSPVIQYAKKNYDTSLQHTNPLKMSDLVTVPQERFGPYDNKPIFTQSRPGGPVHRPPIRESAGELNYQKFLEEFQRSLDEKYNKSLKKEIRPVSRVPPVIPNVIKADTKTPQRAKPIPQQKKPDNSLNTFSRLSYMHKNKHIDIKNKVIPDHGNVSRVSLEDKIGDFVLEHLRKSSQNQSYPVDPPKILNEYQNARKPETSGDANHPMYSNTLDYSQIGNANINTSPTKPILKLNASSPDSCLSDKDQNDLIILLRQQSKFNATAPSSRPMNLKTYPTYPPPSSPNISNKIVKNHFAASTSANTLKKPVNENKQINVISTSIIKPATSAPSAQNTIRSINVAKKNIKVDVQEKSKNPESFKPKILGKAEIKKSEDWQAVMNAIRAQKTPSRGPNALDVALNKSSFEKAFEDSLRRNEFSEQESEIDAKTLKTDKRQLTKHSIDSVDFATRDNSRSKIYDRPKVLNKSAETTNNVSAIKYMNTKNCTQKKANNIDISHKMPVEQPKKKLPYTGHKSDDPFISGIPNSDYDLIEELMDDDLRKEIGELSSDEDFSAAAPNILKSTKPTEKRVSVIYNKTNPALQKQVVSNPTNRPQPQKCVYENKGVGPPKPVHQQYNAISKTCMKVSTPSVAAPSCSSESHVLSNTNTYVQNSIAVNSNVYISALPQAPVQNVVLIGSNVVYEGYTNVQRSVAVTNMTPNAYVAVNNVPNMTLYQSTQYAAPVINPVIIERAITMPIVSNMPCSIAVQTNAVNNSIHSEYSTNKEVASVQEYSQPNVANCEVSKIEFRPNYNSNDPPNNHVKTDVNMLETNLNKNSERKVLSEVQEKQVFSQLQEKQVVPEVGEHKEKSKKIDYNKIIDQERLRNKRTAIMNRKICHFSERKPIALGYSPIFPVVQNTLSESDHNCNSETNIEDQKTEVGLEVASPASQDSLDNCKENKDNALTCRRILLRSSNKLKVKVPNDTSTKIVVKNTTIEATDIAKEANTGVAKIVEGGPVRKRVSKRLREKPLIKQKTKKQNPRRRGKKVPLKTKFNKVIGKLKNPVENIDCSMNFIDIEAELVGSKIPKTCKVENKTNKYRSVSNDNSKDDETLNQSVSQNDDNIEKPLAGIDHDTKVATRRSSRLAGTAKTQSTQDDAEILSSMATDIEMYVPILSDSKSSVKDSLNLPDINIEKDCTSIATTQNDTLVLEQPSELNQNQTEPVISNFLTDNNTLTFNIINNRVSEDGKDKNIRIVPSHEMAEPVTNSIESSINNEAQKNCINDGLKQKIEEIEVTSNDKSVNVDNGDMSKMIKKSGYNLPNTATENEVEKKKNKTFHNSLVTSNDISVNVNNIDMTETYEESGNILPTIAKEDKVEEEKEKPRHDSVVPSNDQSVNVDNSDMTETIEESGNKLPTAAKEDEVEREKDKTCHDFVVPSNDKSVNVDNSHMIKTSGESSNIVQTSAKENDVQKEKDTTLASQHDGVQSNDTALLRTKTPETLYLNNTVEGNAIFCNDVIKSTNDCKTVNNGTENNVNISDIPQSFKDSIKIDHIPNQNFDDPLKKCVRIKLPNGRVFKATVYGQLNVDFDSLFEEPSIKSVLLNSLTSNKKNFTLNVKQTTTTSRNDLKVMSTRVRQVIPKNQGQIIDTVNLLSDDEEEILQEFTTEYGKYKIQPIDTEVHKMHQNKFKQKSAILLNRCDHKKYKSVQTTMDLPCNDVLSNDDCIQLHNLESPIVSSTKSIENIIESVKATWEKLKENVSSNSKINEKTINMVYSKENEKSEEGDVVLIDDSSSEDELLNIRNKDPEVINVLANKLLKDMGVGVFSVPKIDGPLELNHIMSSKPIEIPEIDLTEDSSASKSIQSENIKNCFVKLVRCDDLVNLFLKTRKGDSNENITDEKTTSIVNENIVDVDVANTETSIDANNDSTITIITNLHVASPKPRSRSNSFSILDDFPIITDIDMQCPDHDRSSPVIEAFDLIASYEYFLKPKLKSPQMMPVKCDSDWFATKTILSCHIDSCKNLQDVSPVIPLCCDSEWFTTKDIISKQIMINSSAFEPLTVLSNADIKEMSTIIIEVPSLTSLTLACLQSIDLLINLQPISSAHYPISGTLKRKLVPSNEVSTPKITKLNNPDDTNAQNNSSTDSDLTDMTSETICDEDSITICNNTPVLLESVDCITATNESLSESVNTVVHDNGLNHNLMEIFDNKTDVTLSMVANEEKEEQIILNYSNSYKSTNATNPNLICEGAYKSNNVVCKNMQIGCIAEKSDIIDVCKNEIVCTVEGPDVSAIAGYSENGDSDTITNLTSEETTQCNNVMCESMDSIIIEQLDTVQKYEPSNKLTQEDSNVTNISGDSRNLRNSNIIEQLDIAETCEFKSTQTLDDINVSGILDDTENSVVNDLTTKPESVVCANIDETLSDDVVEMYASKIAQDEIYFAALSNDSVNKNEIKEITDVVCEKSMVSDCVLDIKSSEANKLKIIEGSESIPAISDDTKNDENSLDIDNTVLDTTCGYYTDLLLSEELNKGSKTIEIPIMACDTELGAEETVSAEEMTADFVEENCDNLEDKSILNKNENISTSCVSNYLEDDTKKANKCEAVSSPASGDSALNWEMSIVNPENTVESLPALPDTTQTTLTKYLKLTGEKGSEIILKGIEYVDPEAGTCYMFPLVEQSTSPEVSLEIAERDEIINLIREVTDGGTNDKIEVLDSDADLEVSLPINTYSKVVEGVTVTRNLKRRRDMSDVRLQEKKYRKGKNIDYPKITVAAMNETVYIKEYKRLIDYYSTLKFSYSRPFHKENIDVDDMMKDWPLRDVQTKTNADSVDVEARIFTEEDNVISPKDPLEQTLAQELNSDYNETEYKPTNIIETNFSMGFGEGSGRVIQHSKIGKISKLSAATLSDVKPHQPYLSSESNRIKINNILEEKNNEKAKLIQNINCIKLKENVRSFFKKSATELTFDFMKEHKKYPEEDTLNFPFCLTSTDFFDQLSHELVVNIVQVGQLPVSAAAQNPVTCDPRVTHVSNVSPSQCSAENSSGDDNQTSIKTEYTELTTADITLPLVQEYAQHHQFTSNDTQESSKTHESDHNICISTEINSEIKIELTEETSQDKIEENDGYENAPPLTQSVNNINNEVPYSYNEVPNNISVESHPNPTMPDETKISNTFSESKDEENVNKTDQLVHAMNAAGITTSSNNINTTNADALVDIISQNAQSDVVTTTQMNTNNYSKSTPINAMALQQALAQILPPPLSQTSASESGQTSTNAVAPPVLHIVQGSNSQTVLNTQNGTPLLHIVQNKNPTTSNGTPTSQANSFGGLSLVDTGLQQGGNQLLHIVNTGNQKNNNAGQLLKRVNLLTNITNVQGSNEQKMVQFVCKSADGKSIQLNAPHQRSMVLRLQAIDPSTIQTTQKSTESQDVSANSGNPLNNKDMSQQEIKSRSVYEENYAKFIQNGTGKPGQEKATSLPKFNQVFGKQVSYQENKNEVNNDGLSENTDGKQNDNLHIDQINEINNPPLLLRKSTPQISQAPNNLVQQIKQTIAPMNIQTMHGGVIYTRQIPVNIGGGQTINLITVPSTELVDDANHKQQTDNKFTNQDGDHVIKIVQNQSHNSNAQNEDNNNVQVSSGNDTPQAQQPQPVLTQMRIKLPMLSKTPQMVAGARVVRPSFFQIQRNVIGGANQPVYQQLVLTTAPPLGQSIRVPSQAQPARPKPPESQSSPESQMSSSTLEQLREFDMVLEQVKERSTVQPGSTNSNSFSSIHSSADTTDSSAVVSTSVTETTQQVLYTTGNQTLNIASYVNRKSTVTSASTSFVRSPDSSGIVESPSSSTHNHIPHTATSESTSSETPTQPKPKKKKSKPSSSATSAMKLNTTPPKTSTQKPLEDEQTTQRILYILAEYKEQVENSPDKDKPAPRRRNNLPTNASGSSKRKKSSSGSRRRDMSPILGEDSCRTMGSEDSSCGTSLGECAECMESHSPQESPRKVVRRLTFEQETTTTTQVTTQTRTIPQRNVIVADGQTITVARGPAGKPATTVLMPANYLLPVSMVKGGQQIAIVTNRGPKLLVGSGEGGTGGTLLFQRLIGPAGLKPVLTRPGVRHIRLPTAALHNLQAFNLASAAAPVDSTASPAPAPGVPAPPDLVDSRAMSSPWSDRDTGDVKPERGSSPEGSEPWNLPSSSIAEDYGYEEVVRTDNMDRTVLDAIPDRYSPDMEAQRIFDKMFDVDSKKSMYDSSRCGYDIDASDTDDRPYQVVQRKDGRHHRLTHVSAAALRHKYAILEQELRLQKSLSEECEDLGVDSPSASELFPEAELLFAPSPVHEQTIGPCHTPQPTILNQGIPQPDLEDQIATDHLLTHRDQHSDLDINLDDVGEIVTVGEDGMAMIPLDHEEFARSHPNTTFHTEPEDGEIPPFTIAQSIKGRQITFHASRGPSTVVMAPQTTVISQATVEASGTQNTVKFTDIDNMINSLPSTQHQMPSVLVKDDGLTRFDNILTDTRELHLSNTASAIVHSTGQGTQVIRRVRYDESRRESRYLIDEPDPMEKIDDNRDLESMAGDDNSSSERHPELFWESNSASERSEGRRRMDFSSDSDKCCKSPFDDSTDSSFGNQMRLDSVIKAARTERSGSDGSSDDHPPLRTYPAKRTHHHQTHHDAEQSLSGKTRAGERCMDVEGRRRASNRGVVKRGCHCCNGSPAPPKPKKSRPKKTPADFTNTNNN